MGCWGISAFESDAGLDAVGFIRGILPKGGKLKLSEIIEAMKKADCRIADVENGESHTGPMALAEIVVKYLTRDMEDLDYDEEWGAEHNKFEAITEFTADKESVQWLRDYIAATLKHSLENAAIRARNGSKEWDQWGGWFKEENWLGWKTHMSSLIEWMNTVLASPENPVELIRAGAQNNSPIAELQA